MNGYTLIRDTINERMAFVREAGIPNEWIESYKKVELPFDIATAIDHAKTQGTKVSFNGRSRINFTEILEIIEKIDMPKLKKIDMPKLEIKTKDKKSKNNLKRKEAIARRERLKRREAKYMTKKINL